MPEIIRYKQNYVKKIVNNKKCASKKKLNVFPFIRDIFHIYKYLNFMCPCNGIYSNITFLQLYTRQIKKKDKKGNVRESRIRTQNKKKEAEK